MRTLFLMPGTWDLEVDSRGDIAVAEGIYQQAQDVCSAARTFRGDLYYDQEAGIPYLESILGQTGFPLALYKMYLEEAAVSVDGVVTANAALRGSGKTVTGAILFTNTDNEQGQIDL